MSEDNKSIAVKQISKYDTPEIVKLDGTWTSLVIWFVGRFGIMAIVALVFGLSTKQIYEDMRADAKVENKERLMLMEAFQENTKAIRSFEQTLDKVLDKLEDK